MPTATAPGKLILFGEHAVMYGKLGIATAINLRTTATAQLSEDQAIKITATDLGKESKTRIGEANRLLEKAETLWEEKNFDALKVLAKDLFVPIKVVLAKTLQDCDYDNGITVTLTSKIPRNAGLGSSSSIFAATAAAAQACFGPLDNNKITNSALLGDAVAHAQTPSGIINHAVTHGGHISYKKPEGMKTLRVTTPLTIIIGNVELKTPSWSMDAFVQKKREQDASKVDAVMNEIDKISNASVKALEQGDISETAALMNQNHEFLRGLGVVHPLVEKLVKESRGAGAIGAKMSGPGGGGVMFALCKDDVSIEYVKKAILAAGCTPITTTTGAEGVKTL